MPPMLADRLKTLAPSSTLAVQAKARELRARGIDVISFGAGEPDFDTPERIKAAAVEAMRRGQTKYTDVAGVPELRAAVCAKLKRDHGLAYEPDDVLVSYGAKHTLFNMAVAVLDPGDEVLIPSPYWVSYPEQARLVGGMPVEVPTREATGFDLDPERLAAAVTPRTKALVLNSPNNPTGAVFSAEALGNVARLAVDAGLLVVSDECYEALTFEGRHVSIASLGPEIKARTLVINTCSKAYAMTGWRIGYAARARRGRLRSTVPPTSPRFCSRRRAWPSCRASTSAPTPTCACRTRPATRSSGRGSRAWTPRSASCVRLPAPPPMNGGPTEER